jgi:hypothetical protein
MYTYTTMYEGQYVMIPTDYINTWGVLVWNWMGSHRANASEGEGDKASNATRLNKTTMLLNFSWWHRTECTSCVHHWLIPLLLKLLIISGDDDDSEYTENTDFSECGLPAGHPHLVRVFIMVPERPNCDMMQQTCLRMIPDNHQLRLLLIRPPR